MTISSPTLTERIISELQRTDVKNLSHLIQYMEGEKGFFWVRSGGHDHWTNGTAQHSWRVYQYMRYMWEHPEEIPSNRKATKNPSYKADPDLAPVKVKALTENEIILSGLLHDLGKMKGCSHHASNSKLIIDKYLGAGFSERNPKIVAAIFFHHNMGKDGGSLNVYRNTTLKKLLNRADTMAAGTTWNSSRYKEKRSQRHGATTSDMKHLRRVAMDRTHQVLDYRMYLDHHYNLCHVVGIPSTTIQWNVQVDNLSQIIDGLEDPLPITTGNDYITSAHRYIQEGKSIKIVVGIEILDSNSWNRYLRQNNPAEEELLICSNIHMAFYSAKDVGDHRYAYTMRDEALQHYRQQSKDKGVFLPRVTFFRDGESEGFRMVEPWTCDVLLVPDWKGCMIVDA